MSRIGRHPGSMGQRWAGGEWIWTIDGAPLKRCQAKIVCLVLGSSDPNYRTKQMEVGDAHPSVMSQQIGTQSLKNQSSNKWMQLKVVCLCFLSFKNARKMTFFCNTTVSSSIVSRETSRFCPLYYSYSISLQEVWNVSPLSLPMSSHVRVLVWTHVTVHMSSHVSVLV